VRVIVEIGPASPDTVMFDWMLVAPLSGMLIAAGFENTVVGISADEGVKVSTALVVATAGGWTGLAIAATGPVNKTTTMMPVKKLISDRVNESFARLRELVEIIVAPSFVRTGPGAEYLNCCHDALVRAVIFNIDCAKKRF